MNNIRKAQKPHREKPLPVPEDDSKLIYTVDEENFPTRPEDFTEHDPKTGKSVVTTRSVLRYIALNQGVNSPKLSKFFSKTMKTVSRFTTELRYRNFVEFRGSLNRGGYYLKPEGLTYLVNPEASTAFEPKRMTSTLVLDFIRENPGVNHYAIAAYFQRTIKSATRHTLRLRKKKQIVYRGTPRDGGFYVKPEKKPIEPEIAPVVEYGVPAMSEIY